jgi:hypothetical protein
MEAIMEGIVFVPGIFGSELYYNNGAPSEIWPPGPLDAIAGKYTQINELSDPVRVSVGDIIPYIGIPLFPVYSTIDSDLRDICNKINDTDDGPYLPAPYDWRVDLFTAARNLEQQVAQWAADPTITDITFFAHSMGGLVVRLLLESVIPSLPAAQKPAWVSMVRRAVFACTPHLGAPKALAMALGLEGDETLNPAQCKQLSGDPNFPSAYELIPSPARNLLFDANGRAWIPYNRADVVAKLGLYGQNITAGDLVRGALDIAKRNPTGMEYFFMYGTGLETDEFVEVVGLTTTGATVSDPESGDGTVPTWSITEAANQAVPPVPTWSGPGEHLQLLSTDAFRQELYRYFGLGTSASMVEAADSTHAEAVSVHCNKRQYAQGASMHILLIPDAPTETLSGTVQIRRVLAARNDDGSWSYSLSNSPVASKTVYIEGGPVKTHSLHMNAPTTPGAYQLEFSGDDATHLSAENAGGWFFVHNEKDFPTRGVGKRRKA